MTDNIITIYYKGEQPYRLVEIGAKYVAWKTNCITCGTVFEITTGKSSNGPWHHRRRCDACKQPGKRAKIGEGWKPERENQE